MKEIASPLTGKKCEILAEISSSKIIALYERDFSLDVSAFFKTVSSVSLYRCPDSHYAFYHPFNIAGDEQFYALLERAGEYYPAVSYTPLTLPTISSV